MTASSTAELSRSGRSHAVADQVRAGILDGTYPLGARLPEPELCAAFDVSRNTLRESFRVLGEERLVVHELNRGVFVRVPTEQDVRELYDARRLVECAAVRDHGRRTQGLAAVAETLERAGRLAATGDWVGVGTADIDFHRALTALGSVRVEALMQSIWNEMRLAFHVVGRPDEFHGTYLARNHVVLDTLVQRGGVAAAKELRTYLDEAEQRVLRAYRTRAAGRA
ncbi:GntR family transcriptional regulator [Kineococcus rhizosphaerae]|uniref:GntR family transcriptional regulator n=1 Tax=Kineococcus rhizosphaerae TaxID=559628 RepID=A0A2T0R6N7_9ACTN|nr:GntR family transcriptional regulator [Kineococcus rhizosphaerae]PRY16836.1 GntR family transcriptional regulator [Kineococcus rhizosphaerae]